MKKNSLGIGLLLVAGLVVLQSQLPAMKSSLWTIVLLVATGLLLVKGLLKKHLLETIVFGTWFFMLINGQFHLVAISNTSLLLAAGLTYLGLRLLSNSRYKGRKDKDGSQSWEVRGGFTGKASKSKSTVFGSSSRYVQDTAFVKDSIEVAFGTATVYLDHATMLGDRADFNVDGVFSTIYLYLPSDWRVEVDVDSVFSTVDNQVNGSGSKVLHVSGDVAFVTLCIYSV